MQRCLQPLPSHQEKWGQRNMPWLMSPLVLAAENVDKAPAIAVAAAAGMQAFVIR